MQNDNLTFAVLKKRAEEFAQRISDSKLRAMFEKCFFNTLDTTTEFCDDGSVYIFTGDIDAMWLRDSSAQVMQYVRFAAEDPDVAHLVKGLVKKQLNYINQDPYANAFGKREHGNFVEDLCEKHPYVWERKFELDSLCYPLWLATKYYETTGDASIFDEKFKSTLNLILNVFTVEQNHNELSPYFHFRPSDPDCSVPNKGKGDKVRVCGLVWSGYRPSDDACKLGYFVPGNMFICVVFGKLAELPFLSAEQKAKMLKMKGQIEAALEKYAVFPHPKYGDIYAFEVDGLGHFNLMDDANVPSLLSAPYLGFCDRNNALYQATRKFVLSGDNPYFYSGSVITGVGSPHTPKNCVWPISVIMQCLTSDDEKEINTLLESLINSDDGTMLMHESIDKDNMSNYTRKWFAWANSLFSLMLLEKADYITYIK